MNTAVFTLQASNIIYFHDHDDDVGYQRVIFILCIMYYVKVKDNLVLLMAFFGVHYERPFKVNSSCVIGL